MKHRIGALYKTLTNIQNKTSLTLANSGEKIARRICILSFRKVLSVEKSSLKENSFDRSRKKVFQSGIAVFEKLGNVGFETLLSASEALRTVLRIFFDEFQQKFTKFNAECETESVLD